VVYGVLVFNRVQTGSPPPSTSASHVRFQHIQRCLTENESQRTEVTGYINQMSIQLHRWQLRLQTLDERKADLEKELAALGM
jgi:phage-related tail protein